MAGRLEKLLMRVELIDKATGPANRIASAMDQIQKRTEAGFANVLKGAAGLWGAGAALTGLTSDYHDFHRAIGEVSSLSVADDAMAALQKRALKFSIQYGESATDFVRSSYDIQSAIAGLVGNELATFTEASNILAKGTKADAATITNYMGTMYGIFKNQADAMGKANWVKQLTGQTAQAVEMFKTNGVQMSGAFTALGADATAHGVAINEQMAVLGKLQATMSGSEAGTKYKAFLRGVGKAQEELGMKFTDSAGRMLPVDQILSKLQGKFGAIDTVAKSDMLKKAFGSDEAVAAIKLLIADTNGLSSAINSLGSITGMEKARAMAEKMTMRTDQLKQASVAVRIGFGALVDKALMPFYDAGIKNLSILSQWIDKYPNLFGALAKLLVMVAGVTAAVALLAIIKGVAAIAAVGFGVAMTALRVVMVPFGPLLKAIRYAWLIFNIQLAAGKGFLVASRVAMLAFTKSLLIHSGALRAARFFTMAWTASLGFARAAVLATAISAGGMRATLVAMRAGFIAGATGAWAFTAALLANPITWVVIGVVALIAGLVLLVKHWSAVKSAVGGAINYVVEKWKAFRTAIESTTVIKFLFAPLFGVVDLASFLFSILAQIPQALAVARDWFVMIGTAISSAFIAGIDWVLQKLSVVNEWLLAIGSVLSQVLGAAIDWVSQKWQAFTSLLSDSVFVSALLLPFTMAIGAVDLLLTTLEKIPAWFTAFKDWLAELNPFDILKGLDNVLVGALNLIPGVSISKKAEQPSAVAEKFSQPIDIPAAEKFTQPVGIPAAIAPVKVPLEVTTSVVQVPPAIARAEAANESVERERSSLAPAPAAPVKNVPTGGLQQQFNSSTKSRSTNINQLNVNTTQAVNGYSLQDQLRMAGG